MFILEILFKNVQKLDKNIEALGNNYKIVYLLIFKDKEEELKFK